PQRGSARVPRGPAIPAARARRLRRSALSGAYHDFEDGTLVDPLLLASPLLLAQDELLNLPRGGLRQVAELDGGGTLEVRDVLAAKLDDVPLGRALAGLERDERLGPLAPLRVGDRDHRALEHGGVPDDGPFDLDRRDVLAARDDDVLLPIAQLDVPVRVPHGNTARA